MGLDASVRCNCIKDGVSPPHPFPDLLAFDETGEPILESDGEITLDQWLLHDSWYDNSCAHSGRLISKRLGNSAMVASVSRFIEATSALDFPILSERVVYSGSHSGDWIAAIDASLLLNEARKLDTITRDPLIHEFANSLIELAEVSIETGNPIVF